MVAPWPADQAYAMDRQWSRQANFKQLPVNELRGRRCSRSRVTLEDGRQFPGDLAVIRECTIARGRNGHHRHFNARHPVCGVKPATGDADRAMPEYDPRNRRGIPESDAEPHRIAALTGWRAEVVGQPRILGIQGAIRLRIFVRHEFRNIRRSRPAGGPLQARATERTSSYAQTQNSGPVAASLPALVIHTLPASASAKGTRRSVRRSKRS